jgi:hypothetical protein
VGRLASLRTGELRPLRHEHLIGRSRACDLHVEERLASGVHATLRWVTSRWEIRDLGSRNGTFLNGQRVEGEAVVPVGTTLAFGALGEAWKLVDGSPPRIYADRLDEGGHVEGSPELLALPSESELVATILRGPDGWMVEREDGASAVADREILEACGRWRIHLPLASAERTDAALPQADLSEVTLRLAVSRHEEHVEIEVVHRTGLVHVGAYAANELVLELARTRLEDGSASEADRGWVDTEVLAQRLGQSPSCVRQWIYLTRRRFEELGVSDGAQIIERRSREVRLGVGRVRIEPL